jgi:hypothetical protein
MLSKPVSSSVDPLLAALRYFDALRVAEDQGKRLPSAAEVKALMEAAKCGEKTEGGAGECLLRGKPVQGMRGGTWEFSITSFPLPAAAKATAPQAHLEVKTRIVFNGGPRTAKGPFGESFAVPETLQAGDIGARLYRSARPRRSPADFPQPMPTPVP